MCLSNTELKVQDALDSKVDEIKHALDDSAASTVRQKIAALKESYDRVLNNAGKSSIEVYNNTLVIIDAKIEALESVLQSLVGTQ